MAAESGSPATARSSSSLTSVYMASKAPKKYGQTNPPSPSVARHADGDAAARSTWFGSPLVGTNSEPCSSTRPRTHWGELAGASITPRCDHHRASTPNSS